MEFEFYTAGRIVFGAGSLERLGELAKPLGTRALVVTGAHSAQKSGLLVRVMGLVETAAVAPCAGEPTVEDVDRAVALARAAACDFVVAVGGGSALDCGKAAAGMLTNPGSLEDYLEGVGIGATIDRTPAPMIAIPTTAGTGTEVTKNAVIRGPGYKKSVRSPKLIPDVALVDPDLLAPASREVLAACGMDALTQVIESYLSRNASPMTDALAREGIRAAGKHLVPLCDDPTDTDAREAIALTSLFGGICLANAGLGAVHGFASPIGAHFPIPHGVVCGALLATVLETNLDAARGRPEADRVWTRFARVAEALTGITYESPVVAAGAGLAHCRAMQRALSIPTLTTLGLREGHFPRIIAGARGSSMRTNPVDLTDAQLEEALRRVL